MNLNKCPLTEEEKRSMVAEAAFLRSCRRAFPGDPVADWLGAEAEIDQAVANYCRSEHGTQESSAYHRLRTGVRQALEKAQGIVTERTIRQALDKAVADLRKAGGHLPASIDRASKTIRLEMAGTVDKLGHRWDGFRIRQKALFAGWKGKSTRTWNRSAKSFHQWFGRWRSRNDD